MKSGLLKMAIVLAIVLVSFASCGDAETENVNENEEASALKIDGQWEYLYQNGDSTCTIVVDVNATTADVYYAGVAYEGTVVEDVKFTSKIDSIRYSEDGKSGRIFCMNADTVHGVIFEDLTDSSAMFLQKGGGMVQFTRTDKYTINK